MTDLIWTRFNSAVLVEGEAWLRKGASSFTPPDTLSLVLCNGGSISRTATPAAIATAELLEVNGYTRQLLTFAAGSYNSTSQRGEWLANPIQITANQTLQYDCAVIWANGSTGNLPVPSMTSLNSSISITGYIPQVGDALLFTGSGTIAGGLTKNTAYYVSEALSTNHCKVSATKGGSSINITSDSSGDLVARFLVGWPECFCNFSSTQQILNGGSCSFVINWARLNAGG